MVLFGYTCNTNEVMGDCFVAYIQKINRNVLFFLIGILLLLALSESVAACAPLQIPAIIPPDNQTEYTTISYSFRYPAGTGIMTEVAIPIDRALYGAVQRSPHEAITDGACTSTEITEVEVSRILDSRQNDIYLSAISSLGTIQKRFDETRLVTVKDTYLPVLLTFVASLSDDPASNGKKFPVETLYDKKGSQNDKVWLLLGLMEKKGYNVALIDYGSFVAPAISAASCTGREGYLFIDMNDQSIGKSPKGHASVDPVNIIRIGSGTMQYESDPCISDASVFLKLRFTPPLLETPAALQTESRSAPLPTSPVYGKNELDVDRYGYADFNAGNYPAALSALVQSIQNGEDDHWTWNNLGAIYVKQNRYAEAESAFQRALEINPKFVEAMVNMAYLLRNTGGYVRAEMYIDRALAVDSTDPVALYEKGILRHLAGDDAKAVFAFQQAITSDPTLTQAQTMLDRISSST